jgi:dTDP-4-dehydro-6-deoxy-alpha-D-glucopyranose 2,3-dehydratase
MKLNERVLDVLKEEGCNVNEDMIMRVKQLVECLDGKSLHSLDYVLSWFEDQRKKCGMEIKEKGLNDLKDWKTDSKTGNVSHKSGEFFSVIGIGASNTSKREVRGWDQPMIHQKEGGILGILCKKINGVVHYLLHAKAEPGNIHKLQLSPTLQATHSNLKRAHAGKKPKFAEYFESAKKENIIYSKSFAEDGGRFYLKVNQNMLVELSDEKIEIPDDYIWVTMHQIKQLLKHDNLVNPHVRSIISYL